MAPKVKSSPVADNLPIKVIEVNGKQFVSGLLWEKLDNMRTYMTEARRKANSYGGLDIVAIRATERTVQAGFAPRRNGANKGLYSMAVVLASQFGDDFVAVLRHSADQYVFVACADGAILPGGCDVITDRDDAETKLREMRPKVTRAAGHRPVRTIAPVDFGLDGETVELETALAVANLRRDYQLKPLAFGLSQKEWRYLVASTVLVLGVAASGLYVKSVIDARQQAANSERARLAAIQEAKRLAGIQQGTTTGPGPTLPHPWLRSPDVRLMVATCTAQLGKLPLVIAGWELDSAHCEFGSLAAVYRRDAGSIVTLDAFKDAVHAELGIDPTPNVSPDGLKAQIAPGFKTPPVDNKDGAPAAENPTKWAFLSYFQAVGLDVSLTRKERPSATAERSATKTVTPVQDWTTYTFAFTTDIPPDMLFEAFDLSTVRITAIETNIAKTSGDQTWSVAGAIYVN